MFLSNVTVVGPAPAARKATALASLGYAAIVVAWASFSGAAVHAAPRAQVTENAKAWEVVTLDVEVGRTYSETGDRNPFTDVAARATFESGDERFEVPAYFAADGEAADTGASEGSIWRVHFVPPHAGTWNWKFESREGERIAVADDRDSGTAGPGDGLRGSFDVAENPNPRGLIQYVGDRYLRDAATGEAWLKAGADSPENFLAYADFDGLQEDQKARPKKGRATLHRYEPHVADFREGDPTWGDGKGRGMIGALNYLASQGVNSVYFLPNNLYGDGDDVFPYVDRKSRDRFDSSRLAQWERVFEHMDRLGISLHVILSETENQGMFEQETGEAEFAWTRKLYYRELVARFAHHRGLVWNLGEENGPHKRDEGRGEGVGRRTTDAQRKAWGAYLKQVDPWDRPVVVHTYPGMYDPVYEPLLGSESLDGASLQMGNVKQVHAETKKWIERSAKAGRQWVVNLDEIGPADVGVAPDAVDPAHDAVRREALWGNLLAGGGGVEWYFGYKHPHHDLNLEDFRSREAMWRQTAASLKILRQIPFDTMQSHDELVESKNAWCLADPGKAYLVYVRAGEKATLKVPAGTYRRTAYDPLTGDRASDDSREVESGSLELTPGDHDRAFSIVRKNE
ncbi:MAG TPA: DUF5060 domain-containing protein [Pirellulaceae bacterium]|jgi:hypothetical protein|nr:DUF5060 domain-containing protein [Pirellulaceae bacterium]